MLSVLVVAADSPEIAALERELPSVEILRAHGAEDALEKLGRNRRVDAVLLLLGAAANAGAIEAFRDDNPAPPPLFLPISEAAGDTFPDGARRLPSGSPRELLLALVGEISR
jgi:hypothetical protein